MRQTGSLALALAATIAGGCQPSPQANPVFNDAAIYTFVEFDNEEPANLAFAARALEREIYLAVDVEAAEAADRALAPDPLTLQDIEGIEPVPGVYPEGFDLAGEPVDPIRTLPVAVAGLSAFGPPPHAGYMVLPDQTPIEPASPNHYDRTLTSGGDCFVQQDCAFLRTTNDITKDNALMSATYVLRKDYRWVDLNLPDPADVPEGEPIVNDGPVRQAIIARAWDPEVAIGEDGNTAIFQSYTVEVWIPRDGGGFVRDGGEENAGGGTWTADSEGGGALRMMVLWSETSFGSSPAVESVTRNGIDEIFTAQDAWLAGE